jgi:hypothetical protein
MDRFVQNTKNSLGSRIPKTHEERRRLSFMSQFIIFAIGAVIGGCIGVMMMCLLQVSRMHDDDMEVKHNEQEKH